ncbi:MAG TPA: UDP-3-O-(3-hydroxymyristoyl)glucosamine N-acyltransferase [Tepidisphaeraceae bacterium]|nr:UDP-3-O-(3-hydroxymyristoyl)glucosamine N-acyltransferase [Tepidisphaeraceae bacterium]
MRTLAEIATLLGCPAPPDGSRRITGLATLQEAGPDDLSFISSDAYADQLATTRAVAVIAGKKLRLPPQTDKAMLPVDDADLAVAKVLELFAPPVPRPPAGVDPAARVATSATIGSGAAVGPNAFVGERSRIGARTVLHPGVYVGDDVTIGDDCQLFPNVVVRERITIGSRVIIHAGSVLGTDGFGYRWDGTKHAKVPQIGTIVVEDDVEIGSCVCVDRAKFSTTRIGRGTKIDNLVQVAHNVQTGPHCIIVAHVGLAGSAKLGAGVVLGGQVAVRDHVTIGDGAMVAATSAVAEDIAPKSVVSGTPAMPHRQSLREQAALRRLPDLVVQVRKLQEEIEALKKGS